jgi:uncharacterized protein YllA (UPF0747 family)
MEFKVIVYTVLGILYFLYSIGKKAEQKNKPAPSVEEEVPQQKPVTPSVAKPFRDVMRELNRKKEAEEAMRKLSQTESAAVVPTTQQSNYATKGNTASFKPALMELVPEEETAYDIDVRQAFIGSIIFERKF